MEKQIKRYSPSNEELKQLDEIISNNKELQELISDEENNLEKIIDSINEIKSMSDRMKEMIKLFFVTLHKSDMSSKIYQYSNFRNQDTINILLEREKRYIEIIKNQAKKHNDFDGIKELDKIFSTIIVEKKDKKISKYLQKSFKDIKFHDDFKPIFNEIGTKEYTSEELRNMKSDKKKGPRFNNINKITTVNIPSNSEDSTVIST